MEPSELRESLRRLPEARPGEAFTAEVLARVELDERRRSAAAARNGHAGPGWRPTLLAAGLAAAVVAAVGLRVPTGGGDAAKSRGEVAAPAAPATERLDEESGGVPASGGEGARAAAERDERLAATSGGDEAGDGVAAVAAPPSRGGIDRAAAPGAGREPGGRLAARDGATSPRRLASPPTPLVEGVRPGSPTAGDVLATGPLATDSLAGSLATDAAPDGLVGADFFAAPPAGARPPGDATGEATLAAAPAAVRLARLREERERLALHLAAFRSAVPPAEPPVVVLGGDEGLELVFDLGRWAAQAPAATSGAARPAVHSTQGPPRRF